MNRNIRANKGFTLLEILLVIAAIGILAAIVLVAINPNRQIAQVRNAQRRSDINTIYKALEQYLIDNKDYPEGITGTPKAICNNTVTPDCVDLEVLVPTYLAEIPTDPSGGVYEVYINSENNRIAVESKDAELGQNIAINIITTIPTPE
ncbi:MAG: prepilin-type N-terminal cleavage/methylation domain-containing protein, partial [Minisyncoccia bacterium]